MGTKWLRRKESALSALAEWVPPVKPCMVLRTWLYRRICAQMGKSVRIHPGVRLSHANCIEMGDRVSIERHVYLSGSDQNAIICLGDGAVLGSNVCINGNGYSNKICLGKRVSLDKGVYIKGENVNPSRHTQIDIGERTYIGPYACISGSGYVEIGKDCLISSHSVIYANNHNFGDPMRKIREQGTTRKGIVVEDDCWLGSGVKVLDGITIGQGSVIGAGAVVTKDIPSYSVAVGVPAKVVSNRLELKTNPEIYEHNLDTSNLVE